MSGAANETHAEIVAEMRYGITPKHRTDHELLSLYADRFEAAWRREANSIERLVRDAIIDYQEMYSHAPNDEAERDLVERAARGNAWLVAHGFAEEKVIWSKEETLCL